MIERNMKHLCIITEYSRANNYGIGTYIRQLPLALLNNNFKISIIHLFDKTHDSFLKTSIDGIQHLFAPVPVLKSSLNSKEWKSCYYRNIYYLLLPYIDNGIDDKIFHFNFFGANELANRLKTYFPSSKIVLTVHYMDWSFTLLGNIYKLRKALKHPENAVYKEIVNSVNEEKQFMNDYCDYIIAIAQHSYKTLVKEYHISAKKITLIKHGLSDRHISHSDQKKASLRAKYGFQDSNKILIFAGRLDPVKGVLVLLKVFKELYAKDKSLRLLVVGEGLFKDCLKASAPLWEGVTFTGFVNQHTLLELYTISDIGIVPSFHEEFGYVALEMMRQNLPLIVGETTGLDEIVDDTVGIKVAMNRTRITQSVKNLKSAIEKLLSDPNLRKVLGANARKKFLKEYNITRFKDEMSSFYNKISTGFQA